MLAAATAPDHPFSADYCHRWLIPAASHGSRDRWVDFRPYLKGLLSNYWLQWLCHSLHLLQVSLHSRPSPVAAGYDTPLRKPQFPLGQGVLGLIGWAGWVAVELMTLMLKY